MTSRDELREYVKLLVGTHGLSNSEAAHVANREKNLEGTTALTRSAVLGICYRSGTKKAGILSPEGSRLLKEHGLPLREFHSAPRSMPPNVALNLSLLTERYSPRPLISPLDDDVPPDVLAPHLYRAAPYKPGDENK